MRTKLSKIWYRRWNFNLLRPCWKCGLKQAPDRRLDSLNVWHHVIHIFSRLTCTVVLKKLVVDRRSVQKVDMGQRGATLKPQPSVRIAENEWKFNIKNSVVLSFQHSSQGCRKEHSIELRGILMFGEIHLHSWHNYSKTQTAPNWNRKARQFGLSWTCVESS